MKHLNSARIKYSEPLLPSQQHCERILDKINYYFKAEDEKKSIRTICHSDVTVSTREQDST